MYIIKRVFYITCAKTLGCRSEMNTLHVHCLLRLLWPCGCGFRVRCRWFGGNDVCFRSNCLLFDDVKKIVTNSSRSVDITEFRPEEFDITKQPK